MSDTEQVADETTTKRTRATSEYVRWGGLAAALGPLLVLVANLYGIWAARTYGAGAAGFVESATTTTFVAFGGIRLLGGTLLVFGLVALYAHQAEAVGRLGVLGFVLGMLGTVLLTALAWFETFVVPVLADGVPVFLETVRSGETGTLLLAGASIPILVQAVGWVVFGVATYRARVFPRRAAAVLVVGALLLFVPVRGIPVVFQVSVAYLGYLLFTGRVAAPHPAQRGRSSSAGETA